METCWGVRKRRPRSRRRRRCRERARAEGQRRRRRADGGLGGRREGERVFCEGRRRDERHASRRRKARPHRARREGQRPLCHGGRGDERPAPEGGAPGGLPGCMARCVPRFSLLRCCVLRRSSCILRCVAQRRRRCVATAQSAVCQVAGPPKRRYVLVKGILGLADGCGRCAPCAHSSDRPPTIPTHTFRELAARALSLLLCPRLRPRFCQWVCSRN